MFEIVSSVSLGDYTTWICIDHESSNAEYQTSYFNKRGSFFQEVSSIEDSDHRRHITNNLEFRIRQVIDSYEYKQRN